MAQQRVSSSNKSARSGASSKNAVLAAVSAVAILGTAVFLYIYFFRETPAPPSDTNVMTEATPEEKAEVQQQKDLIEKLNQKSKPAGA